MTSAIVEEFNGWLADLVAGEGSDLHVKVGSPPMIRLPEGLHRLDRSPIAAAETQDIADGIVPEDRRERFGTTGEIDFAYSVPNVGRFRVNVFRQRGSVSMVLRKLRFGGPSFEEIGLPDAVRQIADEQRGLILVTGPTGSGKTTTLAAMIAYINETKPVHIVTIEDPIEVLHKDAMASINQREVGNDTQDFLVAVRAALRQDPDVILIGEMRDLETAEIGLRAAITGHMVLSTLHTRDAASAPLRLADMGVPRYMVAYSLQAVVAQRLLRVNCESCSKPRQPDPQETQWLRTVGCDPAAGRIMAGSGCQHCNGSGYAGRIGIYEMLEMDNELAALANSDDPGRFIAAAEQRMAGHLLRDSAAQLALAGQTTVAEAMRVTAQLED